MSIEHNSDQLPISSPAESTMDVEQVYTQYKGLMFAVAYSRLGDYAQDTDTIEEAHDAIQQASLTMWEHQLNSNEPIHHPKAYAAMSARNAALRAVRDRFAKKRGLGMPEYPFTEEEPRFITREQKEQSAEKDALHDMELANIEAIIEEYDIDGIFYMRFVEDQTLDTIANKLGMTISKVHTRVNNIAREVRASLHAEEIDIPDSIK